MKFSIKGRLAGRHSKKCKGLDLHIPWNQNPFKSLCTNNMLIGILIGRHKDRNTDHQTARITNRLTYRRTNIIIHYAIICTQINHVSFKSLNSMIRLGMQKPVPHLLDLPGACLNFYIAK